MGVARARLASGRRLVKVLQLAKSSNPFTQRRLSHIRISQLLILLMRDICISEVISSPQHHCNVGILQIPKLMLHGLKDPPPKTVLSSVCIQGRRGEARLALLDCDLQANASTPARGPRDTPAAYHYSRSQAG